MKVLLDGDILLYKAASAADRDIGQLVDVIPDETLDEYLAESVRKWVEPIKKRKTVSSLFFVMSCPSRRYFRHDVWEDYKANRKNNTKPSLLDYGKGLANDASRLTKLFGIKTGSMFVPNLEGDDVLGVMGTNPANGEVLVVSIDKDILTIPALVYMPNKMTRPARVSLATANRNWFHQAITGDSSDGYKGIEGIGKVGADKILDGMGSSISEMWDAYLKAGRGKHSEEYLLAQVRLARILRHGDYDKDTKEVKLFLP